MPKKVGPKPYEQGNGERLFATIAIIWTLLFGAGYWLLLFAMTNRDSNPASGADYLEESSESNLIPPDHPRQLIDFQLTDCTEHTVTRSDLNGKILIVDFLFTSCSLTCPAVNRQMARIQQLTTNRPDVTLVSLTVDPRDDTPAVLEKYGERFGADTNRWLFLTGDKAQLYDLIGTSFLASDTNDAFDYMPGNFAHTERIAVVDANGRLRGYFDGLNQNTAAAVVNEITKLQNL